MARPQRFLVLIALAFLSGLVLGQETLPVKPNESPEIAPPNPGKSAPSVSKVPS